MARETVYDEIEIEDFKWDPRANVFHYPCPCGDRFEISKSQLRDGEDIATCPSCSLIVRVIYEWEDYEDYDSGEEEGEVEGDVDVEAEEEDETKGQEKVPISATAGVSPSAVPVSSPPTNEQPLSPPPAKPPSQLRAADETPTSPLETLVQHLQVTTLAPSEKEEVVPVSPTEEGKVKGKWLGVW
ncbi:hypothetical protein QFC19_001470 [Naganishia cerealis]|uniref:Uncharacterized protein n=1 Tax=Naganishia cerealis TaxID=610337 RepID=A0ACC2WHS6_9TREE|nr:hypothetical protein QFC19_001470 [Naganishia cerealis]